MSYRDIEDLIFNTLRNTLSVAAGIPSGQIHIKKPAIEFVSKNEDTSLSTQFKPIYPAIAFNYMKDAVINYNNYGDSKYVTDASGMVTAYEPLGDVELIVAISLFTKSRKDQRDYGGIIEQFLLMNKYITTQNDILQNEYFSIDYRTKRDVEETEPFHKAFVVKIFARIFMETIGYAVDEVTTNLSSVDYTNNVVEADISITTTEDNSNPLVANTYAEFIAGSFDETQST